MRYHQAPRGDYVHDDFWWPKPTCLMHLVMLFSSMYASKAKSMTTDTLHLLLDMVVSLSFFLETPVGSPGGLSFFRIFLFCRSFNLKIRKKNPLEIEIFLSAWKPFKFWCLLKNSKCVRVKLKKENYLQEFYLSFSYKLEWILPVLIDLD